LKSEVSKQVGPELLVLVPEVAGSQIFQVNRFRTNDDAAAFIRTSVSPKLQSSTHVFWAMHEAPPPGTDSAGGEALVLIRADAETETVQLVSLVDLQAAASFVRFEVKRGLDPASVVIYWAAFSPLLEELAAGAFAAADEPAQEDPVEEPAGMVLDELEEPSGSGSKARWALVLVPGLLLLIGGVFFLTPGTDSSGDESGSGAAVAAQSQEDAAPVAAPAATEAPAPAPEAGDAAPVADAPAPAPNVNTSTVSTSTPAPPPPAATPKPTPTPQPRSSHVGDLDGTAEQLGSKRVKLLVKIVVHDAAHRPVAGAAVSGEWTGGVSGPASCVTASDGACLLSSKPLDAGASATFRIGGIAADGLPYKSTLNHDPDGDSNGTSITVEG
jgi:hypothetical protein